MIRLQHAIKVAAPRATLYHALTDLDEMAAWHLGEVAGAITPGEVLTLRPKPGLHLAFRTEALELNTRLVQTEVEGPSHSVGRTLIFQLADLDDGHTLVELTHGEWDESDSHLPLCNTHWGYVLHRLKAHVEKPEISE